MDNGESWPWCQKMWVPDSVLLLTISVIGVFWLSKSCFSKTLLFTWLLWGLTTLLTRCSANCPISKGTFINFQVPALSGSPNSLTPLSQSFPHSPSSQSLLNLTRESILWALTLARLSLTTLLPWDSQAPHPGLMAPAQTLSPNARLMHPTSNWSILGSPAGPSNPTYPKLNYLSAQTFSSSISCLLLKNPTGKSSFFLPPPTWEPNGHQVFFL